MPAVLATSRAARPSMVMLIYSSNRNGEDEVIPRDIESVTIFGLTLVW